MFFPILMVVLISVAGGAAIDNQFPKVGEAITQQDNAARAK